MEVQLFFSLKKPFLVYYVFGVCSQPDIFKNTLIGALDSGHKVMYLN